MRTPGSGALPEAICPLACLELGRDARRRGRDLNISIRAGQRAEVTPIDEFAKVTVRSRHGAESGEMFTT